MFPAFPGTQLQEITVNTFSIQLRAVLTELFFCRRFAFKYFEKKWKIRKHEELREKKKSENIDKKTFDKNGPYWGKYETITIPDQIEKQKKKSRLTLGWIEKVLTVISCNWVLRRRSEKLLWIDLAAWRDSDSL